MTIGKNVFVLLTLLGYSLLSTAQTIKKEYYDAWTKTQLMAEFQVNSVGEKHGWFKGYDREGVLVMENNYRNNLMHGVCKEYTTGWGKRQLSKSETYKDGELNGPSKYYNSHNVVTKSGSYLDGYKEGKWLMTALYNNYDVDKELRDACPLVKMEVTYSKGKENRKALDGEVKEYYYPCNKVRSVINYSSGNRNGSAVWYYPNGKIEIEEEYDSQGKLIYSHHMYFNGSTKLYRGMKEGVEVYEEYNKSGEPTRNMLNWATSKNALKDAMSAFENREFAEAAKLFRKVPNEDDARIMDDLANAQNYIAQGEFGGAVFEINKAKKKATNPIIEEFYEEIYPLYLQWLDVIFQDYASKNQIENMEKQLKHQLVDLQEEDVPLFQKLIDQAKADQEFYSSIETMLEEFKKSNVEMKESFFVDENGKQIMSESFVKGKFLYPKSRLVIDPVIESYNGETNRDKKRAFANSIVTMINVVNAIPESDWKSLNKSLKKVDDPNEIKTIIGL